MERRASPSAEIEAEDASCRRRVRLIPLVQVGLGGVCDSSVHEMRTWGSLVGPCIDHPGAASMAQVLFWDVWLRNDFSLCLWRLEQVPFTLPQGLWHWRQSQTGQTQCFKPMVPPSGTHYQVSEYTDGSSSTTKTLVTFQRIVSLPKIAMWDASTCNSTCNSQSRRALGNSHQTRTLCCRAILWHLIPWILCQAVS